MKMLELSTSNPETRFYVIHVVSSSRGTRVNGGFTHDSVLYGTWFGRWEAHRIYMCMMDQENSVPIAKELLRPERDEGDFRARECYPQQGLAAAYQDQKREDR